MKLYPHQIEALEATRDQNRVAYYLDMGLGKTYVGSEKLFRLGARVNLVVCQKSKINDWFNHFCENYRVSGYFFFDLTKKKEMELFLSREQGDSKIVGIINYELLWRRKRLMELENFTLMLDESSLIQNDRAKQTKFILKLNPVNVILLSGTPTAGKYERLWTQAHLLGWKIKKSTYENTYINWDMLDIGGTKVRVVSKRHPYKNVDRLKRKFREHGAIFMKTEDVLTLPDQNFIPVMVDKPKMYDKFLKTGYLKVDTLNLDEFVIDYSDFYGRDVTPRIELIGNTTLTMRLGCRMLASQYNEHKISALKDLIESTNERLIVFYNFNAELDKLKHICEALKRPVSVVNGEHKDLQAYERHEDSVSLIQYQAGAMGLNLQKANKIIYFSLPERSELFEQSKKRIHRIGQKQPCFYYLLMAKGTIDNAIYGALKQRKDFTDELFRMGGDAK